MEDPRDLFLRHTRSKLGFNIDKGNTVWAEHVNESLMEAMFYTIVDYIHHERNIDELGVGRLERLYSYPLAFLQAENPHKWLEEHRSKDDRGLIMFIYDNIYTMSPGKHRRAMLYFINMLNFGL